MSNNERPHARNAPSGAAAWMRCPGMLNFIEWNEVEDESGVPADEGTCLHMFCEEAARSGREAYDFIGETREHNGTVVELDEKLADQIQDGLDYIDQFEGKLFIEKQVNLSKWLGEGQFGTLDIGRAGRREILIADWKWGYNPVSPIRNYQLMLYALGFYYGYARFRTNATKFRLLIIQPRAPGGGGEWTVNLNDLEKFGRLAYRRANETRDPNAPRIPGPIQCQYCPGAKQMLCPEYDEYHLKNIIEDFEKFDEDVALDIPPKLPTLKSLTPERRSYLIKHKASYMKFFERMESAEKDDYMKGLPTPGRKGVEGRLPARQWQDKEVAEKRLVSLLGEDAYTKKILTPTGAEEVLSAPMYQKLRKEGLILQGERQMIMVDEDDARDAVPTIIDLFED